MLRSSEDRKAVLVASFGQGIQGRIANNPAVDAHLRNLPTNQIDPRNLDTDTLQYEVSYDFISKLMFIFSSRETKKEVNSKYYYDFSTVDERGFDLISMMHQMSLNKPDRFNQIVGMCKRLFPEIRTIHPAMVGNDVYTIAIKKKNFPYEIHLKNEGTGLDQLLIMIWKVATAKPGSILFIDEPELHLHPGAQKLLYDFLLEETKQDKQIFVTSHSTVFVHRSNPEQITLLAYSENAVQCLLFKDLIDAEHLNPDDSADKIRKRIHSELGYDPTYDFESKISVMVEGITDRNIIENFSKTLGSPIDPRLTRIQIAGDKKNAKNFFPIMLSILSDKKCIIILDNDSVKPADILTGIYKIDENYRKRTHTPKPLVTSENIWSFPSYVYSIEYYLFEAEAICKAYGANEDKVKKSEK
ncbi:MAG: AAA family ATPase [Nitrososphaeraceae archaeon]